jgi:hypothetical protein
MERNKVKPGILLLALLIMFGAPLAAQHLVFEKTIDSLQARVNFGPNRKNFNHPFFSTSLLFSGNQPAMVQTDRVFTGGINLGYRYKHKLTNKLSWVAESGINRNFFRISQVSGKIFPDTILHHSQTLKTTGLFGGLLMRFRLGQPGDYLGNYIDLGFTGQAYLLNRMVTRDIINSTDPHPYPIEKTTDSKVQNLRAVNYWITGRLGFDRFSLTAAYRLSGYLREPWTRDLPRFEIGIEVSPFSY